MGCGEQKMKILQINAALEFGSTGRNAIELSDYLRKKGHKSIIAYSRCIKEYENSYRINSEFDIKLHGFLSRLTGLQGYFSKRPTKKLISFMKKEKFDAVILGNLHSNCINLPLLFNYFLKNRVNTIIVLHDCFLFTGRCSHYTEEKCFKWKTGCCDCPRLKKDNISWFFDRSEKTYNLRKDFYEKVTNLAVIGVSKWITDEAKQSVMKNAKIIETVYNWVDLDIFKPKKTELKRKYSLQDKFVILGVASFWGEGKGINYFYELSEKINDDCHIVLVGRNDNKKENNKITYINETHDVFELSEIYNMADVFLNFSKEESFGKVTAEALSCGVPAIVPDTTANPELVGEGCGYVYHDFDSNEVVAYIEKVKQDTKESYTALARDYAKKYFNKNDNLEKYYRIIEELVKG